MKKFSMDKEFYKKLFAIALPITFQGLISASVNMLDTIMIGNLDEIAVSAVGLANKIFFVYSLLLFGITSGSAILTAQFWGKRDVVNIRKVLGFSLVLALLGSSVFFFGGLFAPEFLMRLFTDSPETIRLGASYLQIVAVSYPITGITLSYVFVLRGVNKVKLPVIVTSITVALNALLNYMLIYGKLGMPALGVRGAAIGTVIVRVIECSILLIVVYKNKEVAAAKLREMFSWSKDLAKTYFITVAPVIGNEFFWGLGVTMYSMVYGRLGDDVVATITITQTIEQLSIVLFQGLSNATVVILGNEIGANKKELAYTHAKKVILLTTILAFILGGLVLFVKEFTGLIFNVSPSVIESIKRCLIVFALYMPFKMFNYINIVGILRSGGDTRYTFMLDCLGVWAIGLPMVLIGGFVLRAPIEIIYAMVMSEEIFKLIFGLQRMKTKKWLTNLVEDVG